MLRLNSGGPMSPLAIARAVNVAARYRTRDGSPVDFHQIHARVSNYPKQFERTPDGIQRRQESAPSRATPVAQHRNPTLPWFWEDNGHARVGPADSAALCSGADGQCGSSRAWLAIGVGRRSRGAVRIAWRPPLDGDRSTDPRRRPEGGSLSLRWLTPLRGVLAHRRRSRQAETTGSFAIVRRA